MSKKSFKLISLSVSLCILSIIMICFKLSGMSTPIGDSLVLSKMINGASRARLQSISVNSVIIDDPAVLSRIAKALASADRGGPSWNLSLPINPKGFECNIRLENRSITLKGCLVYIEQRKVRFTVFNPNPLALEGKRYTIDYSKLGLPSDEADAIDNFFRHSIKSNI